MKKTIETFTFNISQNNVKTKNTLNKIGINELLKSKFNQYNNGQKQVEIINHNFEIQKNHMWINTTNESKSSLIEGYIQAYINNYPITINPDIIWLFIIKGFSIYLNLNSGDFYKKNLKVEDIKKIIINKEFFSPYKSDEETWKEIIKYLKNKISSNLPDKELKILFPDFSTTNPISIMVCNAMLIYENIKLSTCDITKNKGNITRITLEGCLNDWNIMIEKIKYLDNFGLSWWTKEIINIINNIIMTKNSQLNYNVINVDFWQNIIMSKKNNENENNSKTGWLFKFFPDFVKKTFSKTFNELQIPSSIVKIPFSLSKNLNYLKRVDYDYECELGVFWEIITQNIPNIRPRIKYIITHKNENFTTRHYLFNEPNTIKNKLSPKRIRLSYQDNYINNIKNVLLNPVINSCINVSNKKTERICDSNYKEKKNLMRISNISKGIYSDSKKKSFDLYDNKINLKLNNKKLKGSEKKVKNFDIYIENIPKNKLFKSKSNINLSNENNNSFGKLEKKSSKNKLGNNSTYTFYNLSKKNLDIKNENENNCLFNYLNSMNDRMKNETYKNPMLRISENK